MIPHKPFNKYRLCHTPESIGLQINEAPMREFAQYGDIGPTYERGPENERSGRLSIRPNLMGGYDLKAMKSLAGRREVILKHSSITVGNHQFFLKEDGAPPDNGLTVKFQATFHHAEERDGVLSIWFDDFSTQTDIWE